MTSPLRNLLFVLFAAMFATHAFAAALDSARPGNLFLPEEPIEFSLTLAPSDHRPSEPPSVTIHLLSYDRRIVDTVSPAASDNADGAVLKFSFPPQPEGFYRLEARLNDVSGPEAVVASVTLGVLPETTPVSPDAAARYGTIAHLKRMDDDHRDQMLALITRAGFGWIREGFLWHEMESTQGQWKTARYDDIVERSHRHGISVLPVLCFGNIWAAASTESDSPAVLRQSLPKLEHWENYIREMVRRYGDRIHAWEIWNEPNLRTFWRPEPNAKDYASVLARAHAIIKEMAPGDTVLSAGLSPNHVDHPAKPEWDEGLFVREFSKLNPRPFDALATHPYTLFRHGVTRGRTEMLFHENLDNILAGLDGGVKGTSQKPPLWITEIGVSTIPRVSTEEDAAAHLVNILTLAAARPDIEKVFLYNFRDTGINPLEKEHMFGLVHADYTPKPGYFAVRHFIKTVGGATFIRRVAMRNGAVLHEFKTGGGDPVIVAWTEENESLTTAIALPGRPARARVSNVVGDAVELPVSKGKLRLTITGEPIFIEPLQSP